MTTRYLTLATDGEAEIEVKRSRFLCTLARVSTEEAARTVVEGLRKRHWDAAHHCSAFVLGPDAGVQRSSDDGEPAGTAGAPMLEVLRGREVSDVVAVVTRWFGGVLLGTGGLIRAYSDAVRAGLDEAGLVARELLMEYTLELDHATAGKVEADLRARGVQVLDTTYSAAATLRLGVPGERSEGLGALVAELTGGTVEPVPAGSTWVDTPA
ncbi:YigZ family protein [Pseudactinotalea sp. Z1732]|uniref:YigZ family protein n=1 Tax=Micrococcales TaxID=85006 RepID=UPI003C7B8B27